VPYIEEKPKKKKHRFIRLIIIAGLVYGFYYGFSNNLIDLDAIAKLINLDGIKKGVANTISPAPTVAEYEQKAGTINYRNAMFGQYSKGGLFVITGGVKQVFQDKLLRVATAKKSFSGYYDDEIIVEFNEKPQVLEDDIIKIYARYQGTKKFQMTFGTENEFPYFLGDYVLVTEPKK